MLLIDDLFITLPIRGFLAIVHQVANAVEQELNSEEDAIKAKLRELYMQVETGQISEEDFAEKESVLLDRLDALADAGGEQDEDEDG